MSKRNKLILIEEEKKEMDVIPAAELAQEPIPLIPEFNPEVKPQEETIPEEVKTNAFASLVNSSITREWENIDLLNSAISTFMVERPEDTASVEVFKQIVDEKTAHIGMLQKVLGVIDSKTYNLVKDGEEKAEEIVSEVVPEVKEEPKLEESKKPLKEDMTDDYWLAVVMNEIDYLVQDDDTIAVLNNEEAESVLPELGEEDLKKMGLALGNDILNNEYLWERVIEDIRAGIVVWINEHIQQMKTIDIIPTEESLKKPLKEESTTSTIKKLITEEEFNPDGFYKGQILRALESLDEKVRDDGFNDKKDELSLVVKAVVPELTKEEILEIVRELSNELTIPDETFDYLFEDSTELILGIIHKYVDKPTRRKGELLPEEEPKNKGE
jgi:bacterioferritin (cytochrome b1)